MTYLYKMTLKANLLDVTEMINRLNREKELGLSFHNQQSVCAWSIGNCLIKARRMSQHTQIELDRYKKLHPDSEAVDAWKEIISLFDEASLIIQDTLRYLTSSEVAAAALNEIPEMLTWPIPENFVSNPLSEEQYKHRRRTEQPELSEEELNEDWRNWSQWIEEMQKKLQERGKLDEKTPDQAIDEFFGNKTEPPAQAAEDYYNHHHTESETRESLQNMSVKREYYFKHIENRTIEDGPTIIRIINHVAEINNDDPDSVLVARKNGGFWQYKHEERFRFPPFDPDPLPPHRTTLEMLEWLAESNWGEGGCQIVIPLAIDDLIPVVRDILSSYEIRFLLSFEEIHKLGEAVFSLTCPTWGQAQWGDLGTMRLTRRFDVTYLIFSAIPYPSGDEVSAAKMHGDYHLFRYGKRKYRGRVIRIFFDNLRQDPIWQRVNDSPPPGPAEETGEYLSPKPLTNDGYNLRKVHDLLNEISNEDDLRNLCLFETNFRPVHEQLKEDDRKPKILHFVLIHANQKGLIDQLLDWAKETNPTRYEAGKPYRIED